MMHAMWRNSYMYMYIAGLMIANDPWTEDYR